MMTALLSWLSKSSSTSLHRQIHHLHRCCCYHLRHRCHPRRPSIPFGIIYWARFFARTASQLSTNTRCSSPITIINLVHSIFHVIRLGIKPRGYNVSKIGSTVHTWLHYDESKDLLLSLHEGGKKSTLITSRCAEKAFTSIQGFPIEKMPK